jgi:hypothetical protein
VVAIKNLLEEKESAIRSLKRNRASSLFPTSNFTSLDVDRKEKSPKIKSPARDKSPCLSNERKRCFKQELAKILNLEIKGEPPSQEILMKVISLVNLVKRLAEKNVKKKRHSSLATTSSATKGSS